MELNKRSFRYSDTGDVSPQAKTQKETWKINNWPLLSREYIFVAGEDHIHVVMSLVYA